ncbi:MAG: hypothetical protein HC802_01320 [Caldilineaceae bacterium]|nr:hypothetical protein [Caldilineaceae bacterium]
MAIEQSAALHCRAGAALESTYAQNLEPFVEQLAYHFDHCALDGRTIDYLIRAGQKAQRAYLNDEALDYFGRALAYLDADDDLERGNEWRLAALRGTGEVHATLGDLDAAEPPLRHAIDLAREMGLPPAEQIHLFFPLCHLQRWLGRFDELFDLGREGMTLLGDDASSPEAVMLIGFLATTAYLTGHRRQYRKLTELSISGLRELPFSQQFVTAYGVAAWWHRDTKKIDAALLWVEGLKAEARRTNDLWTLGHLFGTPGFWLNEAIGNVDAISSSLDAMLAIAQTIGDQVMAGYALHYKGMMSWGSGRLEDAESLLTRALAIHDQGKARHMRVLGRAGIGFVRLALGDYDKAVVSLEEALAEADAISYRVHGVQMARLSLAQAYRMLGRQGEAVQLYRAVASEDEADADGLAWIASALAGLERTIDDAAGFQHACHQIATSRRADDPLPLSQWQLAPVDGRPGFSTQSDRENDFTRGWQWRDQFGDSAFSADQQSVVIYARKYYRDLWFNNQSAPQLLRTIHGDMALEVTCSAARPDRPAIGGLLLWQDANHFLRVDWGVDGPGSVTLRGCVEGRDLLLGRGLVSQNGQIELRLERNRNRVRAFCRIPDQGWSQIGVAEWPIREPIEVGLFASGMIHRWFYTDSYPDGTAIRFENVRVQTDRPTRPSIDGRPSVG